MKKSHILNGSNFFFLTTTLWDTFECIENNINSTQPLYRKSQKFFNKYSGNILPGVVKYEMLVKRQTHEIVNLGRTTKVTYAITPSDYFNFTIKGYLNYVCGLTWCIKVYKTTFYGV